MSVETIGPFEHHDVVVDGWRVPLLQAEPLDDGATRLVLDRRFSLDLSSEQLESVAPFLADAIAVALGFASHPRGDGELVVRSPLTPVRMMQIGGDEAESPLRLVAVNQRDEGGE